MREPAKRESIEYRLDEWPRSIAVNDDWWCDLERDVLGCLEGRNAVPTTEVAKKLGLSEAAATSLLSMMACAGRIRICTVQSG